MEREAAAPAAPEAGTAAMYLAIPGETLAMVAAWLESEGDRAAMMLVCKAWYQVQAEHWGQWWGRPKLSMTVEDERRVAALLSWLAGAGPAVEGQAASQLQHVIYTPARRLPSTSLDLDVTVPAAHSATAQTLLEACYHALPCLEHVNLTLDIGSQPDLGGLEPLAGLRELNLCFGKGTSSFQLGSAPDAAQPHSLRHLTALHTLRVGATVYPYPEMRLVYLPSSLRELELERLEFDGHLDRMLAQATALRALRVADIIVEDEDFVALADAMAAMSHLTRFLCKSSDVPVHRLPPSLRSLDYGDRTGYLFIALASTAHLSTLKLARLTGLEDLSLAHVHLEILEPDQLASLGRTLRGLTMTANLLVDANGDTFLLDPAVLTALTSLHLDNTSARLDRLPASLARLHIRGPRVGFMYDVALGAADEEGDGEALALDLSRTPGLTHLALRGMRLIGELQQLRGLKTLQELDLTRSYAANVVAAGVLTALTCLTSLTLGGPEAGLEASPALPPGCHLHMLP